VVQQAWPVDIAETQTSDVLSRNIIGMREEYDGVSKQRASLASVAYEEIRRRIIRLEIPPGEGFTEAELAQDLGLSKTPVREALAQLRLERLVEIDPRSGCRAAPVTLRDTMEVCALRSLLEGEAASLAAGRLSDVDQLLRLERLCSSSYSPGDPASVDAFLELNTEFHCTVAKAGGNERLAGLLADVLHQLERLLRIGLVYSSRAEQIVHEHEELLGAIMSGDADRARSVAVAGAGAAQKMILDGLLATPEVLSASIGHSFGAQPPRRGRRRRSGSGSHEAQPPTAHGSSPATGPAERPPSRVRGERKETTVPPGS
jgi:DNA-binding GntR family transcriptional regulator